jgi:filamentous hemagglutinin family protein
MKRIFPFRVPTPSRSFTILVLGPLLLWLSYVPIASNAQAGVTTAVSPTGGTGSPASLGTVITSGTSTVPTNLCTASCVITGGTRAGNNLFHSLGDFNIGALDSARFQTGLVNPLPDASVSNILARVTGGPSNLFGNLNSATYYPSANLFLMNPAGFLFGPNATVNVGGMMTFTTADYMRLRELDGSNAGIFHTDTAQTSILTSAPVAAFGFIGSNPHSIDFIGGQLTVASGTGLALVGGDISLTPDSSVVPNVPSSITAPGRPIQMTSVAGPGEVAADTGIPPVGMALGTVTLGQGSTLDTSYNSGASLIGDGSGGAISICGGQFVATGATILTNPAFGSTGQGGAVTIVATGPASFNDSVIDTHSDVANGGGGAVSVSASDLTLQNTTIMTSVFGDSVTPVTGGGGAVTLAATVGSLSMTDSAIDTSSSFAGSGGAVTFTGTESVTMTRSNIHTDSSFPFSNDNANGGAVIVTAPVVSLGDSFISTFVTGDVGTPITANSGAVTLTGITSVSLLRSSISTDSFETEGNSGAVTITAPTVTMVGDPNNSIMGISTGTHNFSGDPNAGNAGDIVITATSTNVTFTNFAHLESTADGPGGLGRRGGEIRISGAQNILLDNGTFFLTTTNGQGHAGNIELVSPHVTIRGQSSLASDAFPPGSGSAGTIKITGIENIALESGSTLFTTANPGSLGSAGHIEFNTPQLTIVGGGRARSETFGPGPGGTITAQGVDGPAQSVLISDPGSGIFTNAHDTGTAGNIFVNANSVTIQNGGTLSAATSGTASSATGGTITVDAANTITMNSASITTSSTGVADAGSINLTAMNGFTMQNSTITTQAGEGAGGGDIKITTSDAATVELINSKIIASVADGPGGGGNISIDPQFVILQNSQILAQAAQGQGGAITITANLFLPDANSIVNADSRFGVNGTVTIQSPNDPAGGQIQPLGKSPLLATSLLNQRCAALAGGEFSSFTVSGRDSLPTEPGSWLASPLALSPAGLSAGTVAEGGDQARVIDPAQETTVLSLRQIAPAGFLTQAFAVDWSASCQS